MNSPTKLTLLRILLTPFLIVLSGMGSPWTTWVTLGLFLAASLTDFMDGYLARKRNQVTTLGKLLDPLADKLLVLTAFLVILDRGDLPVWVVIIVIGREMAITGLRAFLAAERVVLPASTLGKWKMACQVIALSFLFVAPESWVFRAAGMTTMLFVLLFSLLSAYFYVAAFWSKLGEKIMAEQNQNQIRS